MKKDTRLRFRVSPNLKRDIEAIATREGRVLLGYAKPSSWSDPTYIRSKERTSIVRDVWKLHCFYPDMSNSPGNNRIRNRAGTLTARCASGRPQGSSGLLLGQS